jgi:hypothetical protein
LVDHTLVNELLFNKFYVNRLYRGKVLLLFKKFFAVFILIGEGALVSYHEIDQLCISRLRFMVLMLRSLIILIVAFIFVFFLIIIALIRLRERRNPLP